MKWEIQEKHKLGNTGKAETLRIRKGSNAEKQKRRKGQEKN